MTGAACWRADGTPVGISGGVARPGVRFAICLDWEQHRRMSYNVVLLDMTSPARADRLRAFLPPDFVLTHGTERGDEHMKDDHPRRGFRDLRPGRCHRRGSARCDAR